MVIDYTAFEESELLLKLQKVIKEECESEELVDIIVANREMVKKVMTFAWMTGITVKCLKRNGQYVVRLTGTSFRCC